MDLTKNDLIQKKNEVELIIEYAKFLCALSTILITSDGLLGDDMFFTLSGFVLANIKENFAN